MRAQLTYIFHNCFLLEIQDMTMLFDYPAPELLNARARNLVVETIRGVDLTVWASHSHGDHFSPEIIGLAAMSRKARFIVSKDVAKSAPFLNDHPDRLVVSPGRTARWGDLEIETFPSNDLGVAFLIQFAGKTIYYGGDLANWNWDGDEEDKRLEAFYHRTLDKLAGRTVDVAFSNADARLKNWSGAYEFIERIQPRVFVPMHTFGKTETLKRFAEDLPASSTRVWIYGETGDRLALEL